MLGIQDLSYLTVLEIYTSIMSKSYIFFTHTQLAIRVYLKNDWKFFFSEK